MPRSDEQAEEDARAELAKLAIDAHQMYRLIAEAAIKGEDTTRPSRRARVLGHAVTAASVRLDVLLYGWPYAAKGLGVSAEDAEQRYGDWIEEWLAGREVSLYPEMPASVGMSAGRWPARPAELLRAVMDWRDRRRAEADAPTSR